MKASRALREAADVLEDYPAAMQLRYLQTLNTISNENSSTIVFPLPIELMQNFAFGGGRMPTQLPTLLDK
jgi:erythrocyte band 7 integral membrane protein